MSLYISLKKLSKKISYFLIVKVTCLFTLDIVAHFQTPSTVRKRADGYGTLPKDLMLSVNPTQSTHPHTHNLPPPHPSMGAQGATMRARSTPSRSSSFRTPGSSPRSSLARRKPSRLSSFSKGFLKLRPSRWTTSAPNLGDCMQFVAWFGLD